MKISEKGIKFIKLWEGLELKAYDDGFGTWTIGYGHTNNVYQGMTITEEKANELLLEDLSFFESGVNNLVKVKINQEQFDSLVSFSYNLGLHALKNSLLLKRLNNGEYTECANEFLKWCHVGSIEVAGLLNRRKGERQMFLSGDCVSDMEHVPYIIKCNPKSYVHVREKADINSQIIGRFYNTHFIDVNEMCSTKDWKSIWYGEHGGFVFSKYCERR